MPICNGAGSVVCWLCTMCCCRLQQEACALEADKTSLMLLDTIDVQQVSHALQVCWCHGLWLYNVLMYVQGKRAFLMEPDKTSLLLLDSADV